MSRSEKQGLSHSREKIFNERLPRSRSLKQRLFVCKMKKKALELTGVLMCERGRSFEAVKMTLMYIFGLKTR